ncbi:MAG: M20/M25/M40 family metallo-hydrolase [Candidatus Micrarchaeota archaeon]|nr:M20/M25/M40 family metallo-hydrolase [Candidatus Micrarchaeota archaeon]MDE1834070.1 M20/M25/M40 family metallo-hydrolase [Candidatus Micrarchaeota archaeon]MDE1859670.1 M20/M25/M40 family metallo-hydrolase [Candidatus Micrarchaeota archaeon]
MGDMKSTFCDLVKLPSPSGKELAVALYVRDYLERLGYRTRIDDAGRRCESNTGNLIATIGDGKPKAAFIAHMDTVQDAADVVRPVIKNGVARSDGTTILGADDKAGVAAMLEAARELSSGAGKSALFVFSIREERGCMGVKYLDIGRGIKYVFDIDGSGRIGDFINRSLGYTDFELTISGKAAHAALSPEKGSDAIRTAGLVISKLPLGRNKDGGTMNLGTISGGSAPNIVPAHLRLFGEVRGFSSVSIEKKLEVVRKTANYACRITGCRYKLAKGNSAPPFHTKPGSTILDLARRGCSKSGIRFNTVTTYSTIQGSILSKRGYEVLGICRGGKDQHSKSESIMLSEIEMTKRLVLGIISCL